MCSASKIFCSNSACSSLAAHCLQRLPCERHAVVAKVLGQASFDSESKEAQEFAKTLVENCMAFTREQLQAMQVEAEETQAEFEQKIFNAGHAIEERIETLQAQVHFYHDLAL